MRRWLVLVALVIAIIVLVLIAGRPAGQHARDGVTPATATPAVTVHLP